MLKPLSPQHHFSCIIFFLKQVCTVSVCPTLYTTYMQASASVLRIMRVTELFRIHTCDYARVPFLRCIVCTRLDDDHQPCHIGLRLSGANFWIFPRFFLFSFPVKSLHHFICARAFNHPVYSWNRCILWFIEIFIIYGTFIEVQC